MTWVASIGRVVLPILLEWLMRGVGDRSVLMGGMGNGTGAALCSLQEMFQRMVGHPGEAKLDVAEGVAAAARGAVEHVLRGKRC